MGQELVLQDRNDVSDPLLSGSRMITGALGNVVKAVFASPRALSLFDRSPEHVDHVSVCLIINDKILDLFVSNDVKGTEQYCNRDFRVFDKRD